MEVHDDPSNALSDPNTVLDLRLLERILAQAVEVHNKRLELLDKWGEDNINEK
jgi:2-dehydro-3-deoxyphosphooctonate aldolase (KDO 8-P synthase)